MNKFEMAELEIIRFDESDVVVASITCHGHCNSVCPSDCINICREKCYDVTADSNLGT